MNKQIRIRYVNALTGQGKTHQSNKYIAREVKAKRFILVALPSLDLMQQVAKDLSELQVNSTSISHENVRVDGNPYPVLSQLEEAIKEREKVILITHVTLVNIPIMLHRRLKNYEYIIDETFTPSQYHWFQLDKSLHPGGLLNGLCTVLPTKDARIKRLRIIDEDLYLEFQDSENIDSKDSLDGIKTTKEILKEVNKDSRETLVYKMEQSERGAHCICIRFNVKVLRYSRRVTFMAAHFNETELYHLLKQHYTMVNATVNTGLRNLSHRNKRLTVIPLIEGKLYSKSFDQSYRMCLKEDVERAINHYRKHGDHAPRYTYSFEQYTNMVIEADPRFSPRDTLRVSNLYNPSKVGEAISSKSHGRNDYQHHTSIAIIASFNHKPYATTMSRILYPKLNQYRDTNGLIVLQSIGRTAVRDIESDTYVTALVSDDTMAKEIISLFEADPVMGKHALFDYYTYYSADKLNIVNIDESTHFKNGKRRLTEEEKKENRRLFDKQRKMRKKRGL